jgi:hypothetical protein
MRLLFAAALATLQGLTIANPLQYTAGTAISQTHHLVDLETPSGCSQHDDNVYSNFDRDLRSHRRFLAQVAEQRTSYAISDDLEFDSDNLFYTEWTNISEPQTFPVINSVQLQKRQHETWGPAEYAAPPPWPSGAYWNKCVCKGTKFHIAFGQSSAEAGSLWDPPLVSAASTWEFGKSSFEMSVKSSES